MSDRGLSQSAPAARLADAIAVLLPPREPYRPDGAGAVALCARDFALHSRHRDRMVILGGETGRAFDDLPYLPLRPHWLDGWRGQVAAYGIAAAKIFASAAPALVEIHNRPALASLMAARLPNVPRTLHLHNDPQEMKGARTARERRALLAATRFVYCVSDHIRGRFLDGVDDPRGQVRTLWNGAAPAPVTPEAKRPIVAYVGRVSPEKGVLELAQAAAQVLPVHPHWTLVLAGGSTFAAGTPPTPYEEAVRAALAPLGAQARVLGHVPHDEAMALFAEAEIAVAPSLWEEPFGRVAAEAAAKGCALIGTMRGGLADVVGRCGFAAEGGDPESLAAALRRVLGDEALRRDLQRRAAVDFPFDVRRLTARLDGWRDEAISDGVTSAA